MQKIFIKVLCFNLTIYIALTNNKPPIESKFSFWVVSNINCFSFFIGATPRDILFLTGEIFFKFYKNILRFIVEKYKLFNKTYINQMQRRA